MNRIHRHIAWAVAAAALAAAMSEVAQPLDGGLIGLRSAQAASSANTYDFPVIGVRELETITTGQPTYLKLWATWCLPCMKEMPALERAHEQYGSKVKVLAVNLGLNETNASIKQVVSKYGLKMPVLIDQNSDITQRFGALGTPFHVLIDKSGRIVFKGHEANAELDAALARLSRNDGTLAPGAADTSGTKPSPAIPAKAGQTTAVLFFASWCDWYLEKHRPQDAKRCVKAQNAVNTWQKEIKGVQFVGVASGLWADDQDLANYKKKFDVSYPVVSDSSNELFPRHKISKFPTLVVMRDGKELYREDNFDKPDAIAVHLKQL
jgi:thiol-disulfide isomerase/thioredoxin